MRGWWTPRWRRPACRWRGRNTWPWSIAIRTCRRSCCSSGRPKASGNGSAHRRCPPAAPAAPTISRPRSACSPTARRTPTRAPRACPTARACVAYGEKGLRIYDFGWQPVPKGWGSGTATRMRLRMHATDPDLLERRLGSAQSQGGIRIPATLNRLLDRYGLLDAEYEQAARDGRPSGVLDPQREPVAFPGRYLIVVDSARAERPEWNPRPFIPHRKPAARPAARSGNEHGRSVHAALAQGLDGRVGVGQREGLHMGAAATARPPA